MEIFRVRALGVDCAAPYTVPMMDDSDGRLTCRLVRGVEAATEEQVRWERLARGDREPDLLSATPGAAAGGAEPLRGALVPPARSRPRPRARRVRAPRGRAGPRSPGRRATP